MAVSNVSGSDNAMSWLFSSNSASSSKDTEQSIGTDFMAGSSISVADYSLIQSGAYKKLLTAYYGLDKNTGKAETGEDKKEKLNLSLANQDAQALNSSVTSLMKMDITEDNREEVKKKVKEVVENYNRLIDSGSEVDNTGVLRNVLWMTDSTKKNGGLLNDIGVSIGKGNKLEFNEEKFDKANLSTVSSLVKGFDSFTGRLASRSLSIASAAVNGVSEKSASAYTKKGSNYESETKSSVIDSKT